MTTDTPTLTDSVSFDAPHNPAAAAHPIHDLIRERWSPRAFSGRAVDAATLHSLFEAARWAASAGNQQPWHFVVASQEQPDAHARLAAVLVEKNRAWAQHAPVLVLVAARLYDRPGKEQTSFYDTGMAVANLVLEAVNLGLVTHQMGGFDGAKARETLGIPADHEPLAVIAIGYPGSHESLPDDLRARETAPRTRKPLHEFVSQGLWDQPAVPPIG